MAKSSALRRFQIAFAAGEKSDKTLHECLIEECSHFAAHSHDTNGFTSMVEFMLARAPDGFRCRGIIGWLKSIAHMDVSDKGKVTKRARFEYDRAWMDTCKARPWYSGVTSEFSIPGIGIRSMASRLVVRDHLGESPDWGAILNSLKADYAALKSKPSDKLAKKLEASDMAVAAGTVKRLDVEEKPTHQPPVELPGDDEEEKEAEAA